VKIEVERRAARQTGARNLGEPSSQEALDGPIIDRRKNKEDAARFCRLVFAGGSTGRGR
jgi:hypothetical protein